MQFGIFSVGDVTTDPATGRTPTDHERIRATVEIARLADEGARAAALRWRIDEAVGELRSCLTGVERRHPVDGFEQVIPFEELLKRERYELHGWCWLMRNRCGLRGGAVVEKQTPSRV